MPSPRHWQNHAVCIDGMLCSVLSRRCRRTRCTLSASAPPVLWVHRKVAYDLQHNTQHNKHSFISPISGSIEQLTRSQAVARIANRTASQRILYMAIVAQITEVKIQPVVQGIMPSDSQPGNFCRPTTWPPNIIIQTPSDPLIKVQQLRCKTRKTG